MFWLNVSPQGNKLYHLVLTYLFGKVTNKALSKMTKQPQRWVERGILGCPLEFLMASPWKMWHRRSRRCVRRKRDGRCRSRGWKMGNNQNKLRKAQSVPDTQVCACVCVVRACVCWFWPVCWHFCKILWYTDSRSVTETAMVVMERVLSLSQCQRGPSERPAQAVKCSECAFIP